MSNITNERSRSWFLTIHENADCYSKLKQLIDSLDDKVRYAYIYHGLDEPKHYHLILIYPTQRYFNPLKNLFIGSHIEKVEDIYKCSKYLIHKGFNNKVQYSFDEVISNDLDYFKFYINNEREFIELNDKNLLNAIRNNDILNITDAVELFGIQQVSRYRLLIQTLIEENISNVESYYRKLITEYRQRLSELLTINEMQQYVLNDYDSYFTENGFIKKNTKLC